MYIIVEKDNNFVVGITPDLIDNNDGSFTDKVELVDYSKGDYSYYVGVEVPPGINKHQYYYTEEEGFKLAFSQRDMFMMRKNFIDKEIQSGRYLNKCTAVYDKFKEESEDIGKNIKALTDNSLTVEEKITLLEYIVCDLYEEILVIKGEE